MLLISDGNNDTINFTKDEKMKEDNISQLGDYDKKMKEDNISQLGDY